MKSFASLMSVKTCRAPPAVFCKNNFLAFGTVVSQVVSCSCSAYFYMYELNVTRLDVDSWYYDVSVISVITQQITWGNCCQVGCINDA